MSSAWANLAARHCTKHAGSWQNLSESERAGVWRDGIADVLKRTECPDPAEAADWFRRNGFGHGAAAMAERLAEADNHAEPENTALAARLMRELEAKEMTVEDLTDRINAQEGPDADASTMSKIVNGTIKDPSEPMIAALAKALSISQDELFGLIGGKDESPDEGRF